MQTTSQAITLAALAVIVPTMGLTAVGESTQSPSSAETTAPAEFSTCPIEALRKAYSSLLTEQDTFNMLAVEEQVLLVCRERQELILAYKAGVEDIASGLSELATQNEELIAAQGNLKDILSETQAAKEELEKIKLGLWEIKEQERALSESIDDRTDNTANLSTNQGTPAASTSNDANTDLSNCSVRYGVLGVGAKRGKPYAMLADELRGTSLNAHIGEELPFGVKVVSIRGLKITVETPSGRMVLPTASGTWKGDSDRNTDGLIWHQVDPSALNTDVTAKPVEVKVFRGFD